MQTEQTARSLVSLPTGDLQAQRQGGGQERREPERITLGPRPCSQGEGRGGFCLSAPELDDSAHSQTGPNDPSWLPTEALPCRRGDAQCKSNSTPSWQSRNEAGGTTLHLTAKHLQGRPPEISTDPAGPGSMRRACRGSPVPSSLPAPRLASAPSAWPSPRTADTEQAPCAPGQQREHHTRAPRILELRLRQRTQDTDRRAEPYQPRLVRKASRRRRHADQGGQAVGRGRAGVPAEETAGEWTGRRRAGEFQKRKRGQRCRAGMKDGGGEAGGLAV